MACAWLTDMRRGAAAGVRRHRAAALEHGRADVDQRHGLAVHVERGAAVRRRRRDLRRAPGGQLRGPGGDRVRGARRPRRGRSVPARARAPRQRGRARRPPDDPRGARRHRRRRARRARSRRAFTPAWRTATVEALVLVAERQELDLAVLSGGVFQNRLLLELTMARARARPGCACSCPRSCRPTTARSPSVRSRSRRPGLPPAEPPVCSARDGGFALSERWNGWMRLDAMVEAARAAIAAGPLDPLVCEVTLEGDEDTSRSTASTSSRRCWQPAPSRCRWRSRSRTSSRPRRA